MQFQDALECFLRSCRLRLAPATVATYARDLALLGEIAPAKLSAITIDALESILAGLVDRTERFTQHPRRPAEPGGLSPATLRRIAKSWKTFFNWCVDRDYLLRSPAHGLKLPRPRARADDKAISPDDLLAMLHFAQTKRLNAARDAAIILVLADTACRVGGCASMTLPHLDLQNGSARIVEKGGRSCVVYFSAYTAAAVQAWLKVRPPTDHDHLWTSTRSSHPPLLAHHISAAFRRVAISATGKSLGPHSVRHRAIQAMLDAGINAELVSRKANHSSVTITLATYGNQGVGRIKAITDTNPLLALGGPPPTTNPDNIIRFPA